MKVYVGCGLTHASELFVRSVTWLKDYLRRSPEIEVLDFVGVGADKMTPRDVWNHDIVNCVNQADAMLAVCDEPSTGLGIEIAVALFAERRQIPVLAVSQRDNKTTRLVLDIPHPLFRFRRYGNIADVPFMFQQFLSEHFATAPS